MATKVMKIGLSTADKNTMSSQVALATINKLIDAYSTSKQYSVGDYVNNAGIIYVCTEATSGTWDSTKWSVATLNQVIDAINQAVASVNDKAEIDGDYRGSGLKAFLAAIADNLQATTGLSLDDAFTYQITGGDQASAINDGNADLDELRGNTVVWNQLVDRTRNFSNQTLGFTITYNNGIYTTTGTLSGATNNSNRVNTNLLILNHKYLWHRKVSNNAKILYSFSVWNFDTNAHLFIHNVEKEIFTATSNNLSIELYKDMRNTAAGDVLNESFRLDFIDLTQMFGAGNEPTSVDDYRVQWAIEQATKNPEYNEGTLISSQSTSLISRGRNQWDEEWEVGEIGDNTGLNATSSSVIRSKNYIEVSGNTEYYFKTPSTMTVYQYDANKNFLGQATNFYGNNNVKKLESNCCFIRFKLVSAYGTTYKNDICINISNPDYNGNYYPSKKEVVALPNIELRSAGSAYDVAYSIGGGKRRIGIVDLETFNWTFDSSGGYYETSISGFALPPDANTKGNITHAIYENRIASGFSGTGANGIALVVTGYLRVKTSGAGITPTGILIYELAEETDITTEENAGWVKTFEVEQGGTLEFTSEQDVQVPQGNELFFQKNLKGFVEAFGSAIDWNPARIERLANLSFTPETADITLNPAPANAYAKVQVMSSTFTIVISAALSGTASGSITFQDSEVDLSNFETKPAEAIYDMDGKKVSEEPTTADCNIASFVGRSKSGTILWSLLHSGVNKIKIHFEESVPLDANGVGKIDCRSSLIL